jgi:hypothetical protein
VEKIRSEIDALDVKDKIAQDKLAQTQSWFTPWTWSAPVVSEEERQSMERERLNRNAARTVKQGRLHEAERELKTLKDEKNKRESAESNRMKEEQYKKDRYEQAERAKAEAQRKKEQEERFRQQREAQEKATREYMERLRKAREAQERAAQAARAAREEKKRKEEERVKQEEERMKRQAELQRKEWERIERTFADAIHQQSRSAKVENERRRKPQNTQRTQRNKTHGKSDYKQFNAYEADMHTSSPYICMHKRYWGKQNGRHQCLHCKEIQPKFAFRCPGCNTIACHTCMSKLKRGEMTTPADEYKYEDMPEDYWD